MENIYLEVYEKLTRLQWSLHKQQIFAHAEYGPFADTSRGQGRVLAILKMKPEISTKDLAYLLGIRQQSLNELLNKLEKKEYTNAYHAKMTNGFFLYVLPRKVKMPNKQMLTTAICSAA